MLPVPCLLIVFSRPRNKTLELVVYKTNLKFWCIIVRLDLRGNLEYNGLQGFGRDVTLNQNKIYLLVT